MENNKVDELKKIRQVMADYDSQINQLGAQIQKKRETLGEEVLAGNRISKIQEEIHGMERNLSDLQQARDVAGRKLPFLEKAVLEAEKQEVLINKIRPLEDKYQEAMIRIILALQVVWETDFTIQACYQQTVFLAQKYEIATSIPLRTVSLGGSDLHNSADVLLKKIEQRLPELYKASKARTAQERAAFQEKIKLPFAGAAAITHT